MIFLAGNEVKTCSGPKECSGICQASECIKEFEKVLTMNVMELPSFGINNVRSVEGAIRMENVMNLLENDINEVKAVRNEIRMQNIRNHNVVNI